MVLWAPRVVGVGFVGAARDAHTIVGWFHMVVVTIVTLGLPQLLWRFEQWDVVSPRAGLVVMAGLLYRLVSALQRAADTRKHRLVDPKYIRRDRHKILSILET